MTAPANSASTPLLNRCDAVLEMLGDRAEAVVTASTGMAALTRFANSTIHQNVAEDTTQVSVTLVVDGRSASANTTQIGPESLRRLVDRTLESARLRSPDPDWPGLAPVESVPSVEHWDEDTSGAGPDERAGAVKAFVDAGVGLEAAGSCATGVTWTALANSAGQRLEGRATTATIDGIHRSATSDAAASQTSIRLRDLDGATAGAVAADRARASAEAVDLEPGTYEVVLSPACVANVLSFLTSAGLNGKSHLDGTSFAHLGEQQFDPLVSLWDDAMDPRTVGLVFDNEGSLKRRVDLIRNGVTEGVVHDRRTAAKAGVRTTGHRFGREALGPRPTNLFFGAGAGTQDDLVAGMERGLVVHDFWYTRILDPKTQVVTGLTRNGVFLVEQGARSAAVRNLRFTQSFVAAFGPGKVKAIGGDAQLINGMHVPSVHLEGWKFTGGANG